MKKILLSVMLLAVAVTYASAQSTAETKAKADIAHWSAGIKAGVDYYRVTPSSTVTDYLFFENSWARYANNAAWTAPQIYVEYTFNPLFGLGADFSYLTYGRNTGAGHTLDFTLYGSTNLSNLLAPKRAGFWGKVNIYGNLGAGLGFYSYSGVAGVTDGDNLKSPLAFAALNAEYRLSKVLSLGVEGQYRYYMRENLGGLSNNSLGSDALIGTIGLRYKFGGATKSHVRDMSLEEYYPAPAPVVIEKTVQDGKVDANTENRLKALENDNAMIKNKLQQLESDLKALSQKSTGTVNATFQNIEFEFGSSQLTKQAYDLLDQIYAILNSNSTAWTKITVSGHTDNIGPKSVNQQLSIARAQAVKDYLVKKGIPASAITVAGYGEDKPIASNDTPAGRQKNRRVEFEISK
ncbi:MAG TPA: OmpA family protein [Paludibacteraceae bacterium]|mgnify:FL=1|jgi:OOP family OmpA-OmpF porin|nr:OmpA family protein [Paludibacteraceae bacterium]OPZ03308.1 MAG: Outer membrane porin F precursor [Bacteroidetes bacterium ADurb.BinA395]MBP8966073.1 OmpA family protein [Paludibacteraceae bacterium]HOF98417.1 OmpA family protein [Paludibacteraceae bacterium]HPL76138.1 OmpA family protein [Paludibacteraceae bacterium]